MSTLLNRKRLAARSGMLVCAFIVGMCMARAEDRHQRAGRPLETHRLAKPTNTPDYGYGYVGGGAAFWWGEPRTLEEGTWGRDYVGRRFPRRVWLGWWHALRYQGGGMYNTDGPKLRR